MVLPEVGADAAGATVDMQMFMGSWGRERTLNEWKAIFDRSGLVLQEIVGLKSLGSLLVLLPREVI